MTYKLLGVCKYLKIIVRHKINVIARINYTITFSFLFIQICITKYLALNSSCLDLRMVPTTKKGREISRFYGYIDLLRLTWGSINKRVVDI
jgi:hypothetical protein